MGVQRHPRDTGITWGRLRCGGDTARLPRGWLLGNRCVILAEGEDLCLQGHTSDNCKTHGLGEQSTIANKVGQLREAGLRRIFWARYRNRSLHAQASPSLVCPSLLTWTFKCLATAS